jgi:hypothetical protein
VRILRLHVLLIGLVAVGAALRLWQYATNPSLDLDELALVRNIVGRPLRELLLTPLLFDQVVPQGFLLAEKSMVLLLGKTEYALRLLPLLSALASLVLFWRISVRVLRGFAAPVALALFALKPTFILYGAAVKQSAGDIAAVLLLMLLALALRARYPTRRRCLLTGVVGAIVAQYSQVAVLVLTGVGLALVLLALAERDAVRLCPLSITAGLWAVGAAAAVALGLQSMTPATHAYMLLYWQDGFMPLPSPGTVRMLSYGCGTGSTRRLTLRPSILHGMNGRDCMWGWRYSGYGLSGADFAMSLSCCLGHSLSRLSPHWPINIPSRVVLGCFSPHYSSSLLPKELSGHGVYGRPASPQWGRLA